MYKNSEPCEFCRGICCRNENGQHKFAVIIGQDEIHLFPDAITFKVDGNEEFVLPYLKNKCVHLGDDNKCKIYERRPKLCREFSCLAGHEVNNNGRRSFFLEDNPEVVDLIELHVIRKKNG